MILVKVRKLVQMMRERLRPFPCRWLDCDAVLNSAHALTHHTALHTLHEEALPGSQVTEQLTRSYIFR
jgi:hypothetical protein